MLKGKQIFWWGSGGADQQAMMASQKIQVRIVFFIIVLQQKYTLTYTLQIVVASPTPCIIAPMPSINAKRPRQWSNVNPSFDYSFSKSFGLGSLIPSSVIANKQSLSGRHGLS